MSRKLTQLTIFVSGSSETDAEKSSIRLIVEDLSKILEKTHGITLRVLSWPDDVRPGVNADPQAEINRQIGFGYDIYVGLLGSRFGTPTPRSGSGTEEEFERALATFQRDSRLVRSRSTSSGRAKTPFRSTWSSWGRLTTSVRPLGPRGVLYHDFQDTNGFVQQLRHHIHSLIVEEWRENAWAQIATPDPDEGGNVSSGRDDAYNRAPENRMKLLQSTDDTQCCVE